MSNNLNRTRRKNNRKDFQFLEGLRVLVVDDDTNTCILTSTILKIYGVQVRTTTSAIEALESIEQFQPNFIIADIAMPTVDGYSLIQELRSFDAPLGTIPAIAITALCTNEHLELAIKSGFHSCLIKPVYPDDLVTEVVKLVSS
ncbi:MAG: response regulator [Nostoc sp. ChiSLP01]|nr:response regulator [Nostoc sp. CmiSLP01]MDZ8284831.1 response regulator [Nostoc sp. ChiSLP01]